MIPPYTIWAKPPGGSYDRVDPRFVESIAHEHGPWGSERLSFVSRKDTRLIHPELLPFTEFACEVGGVPVWSGFGLQAPPSRGEDQQFAVNAAGWGSPYLNDEAKIDKKWVVTDLSRFAVTKENPTVNLGVYNQSGRVEVGNGGVTMGVSNNDYINQNRAIGSVTLDLGPNNAAKRVLFDYDSSGLWGAASTIYCRVHDTPDPVAGAGANDLYLLSAFTANVLNAGGTSPTARRYVSFFVYYTGVSVSAGAELWVKIKNVRIFTDAADESANASILKAHTIIGEALAAGAPKISTDLTGLTATTFSIPDFEHTGEVGGAIQKALAYHGWQFFVSSESTPRPYLRAVPTTPKWVISRADGHHVALASSNDGSELFNQVKVRYQDAAGVEAVVTVNATAPDQTLPGRAGRTRPIELQMKAPTTSAAATQLATIALAQYASTPIKGGIEAKGWVRDYTTGAKVPAGWVQPNDLVLLPDEIDPDTGAIGRTGPIAGTKYDHSSLTIGAELDSRRDIFDVLTERMAVLT